MEVLLESVASRKLEWLAARQSTIAGNIANANTPGYKTKDITPFSAVLQNTELLLTSTNVGHLSLDDTTSLGKVKDESISWETTESGNSVGLENELIKAGNVNQDYKFTTDIMKAFDAMLSSALKA